MKNHPVARWLSVGERLSVEDREAFDAILDLAAGLLERRDRQRRGVATPNTNGSRLPARR
jgi:hypothetical protein